MNLQLIRYVEDIHEEDTRLHAQLQQTLENDDEDPDEAAVWNGLVDRGRQRGRPAEARKRKEDEDEDEGDVYTLKETDMLWEIGCKVRYSDL